MISLLAATEVPFARDLLAVLAAAGLVALLLRPIRVTTIPGYLIAGAIIGPSGFGIAGGGGAEIGHLATMLLLFIIGLHLDMSVLRSGWLSSLLVGLIAAVLTVLIGWPICLAFGLSAPSALLIAMALAISSTAVVLKQMEEKRELHKAHGRLAFGVLMLQDLVVLGMMASVPALATWAGTAEGADGGGFAVAQEILLGLLGVALLVIAGRWGLPRMLRVAAKSPEVLLVVSAAIALGAAVATAALGFSPELGAFLAGFLLASTPFRYQLAGQLAPLRDLLLAVFFTVLGLSLQLGKVAEGWWIVLIGCVLTIVLKGAIMGFAAWARGSTGPIAVFVAFALAQGSEFSLVLIAQGTSAGVLDDATSAYAISIVVLTLIATPFLMNAGREWAPRAMRLPMPPWVKVPPPTPRPVPKPREEAAEEEAPLARAIIAGFGPTGRAVADALEKKDFEITVIELNARTVERQRGLGRPILFGDAANLEVLEQAGLGEADAIILTMPDEEAVLRACKIIRSARPGIFIAARVNALSKAMQAMQLGADHVVVEELATAEAMASQVRVKLDQHRAGDDTGPKLYTFTD